MQQHRRGEHLTPAVTPGVIQIIGGLVGFLLAIIAWCALSGLVGVGLSLLIIPIVYDTGHESGNGLSIILGVSFTLIALLVLFFLFFRRLLLSVKDWTFQQHIEHH